MKYLSLLAMVSLGCTGDKDTGSGGDNGNGSDDSSTSGDDSGGENQEVKPRVKSVDLLDCTTQQSANDVWSFTISVDDPQGAETVRAGSVDVQVGGTSLATYALACRDSMCIGSWRSDYDGIDCTYEGRAVLVFTVEDEDGNQSKPYEEET